MEITGTITAHTKAAVELTSTPYMNPERAHHGHRRKRQLFGLILSLILVAIVVGGWWHFRQTNNHPQRILPKPQYLSFSGNYVFSIPQGKVVDEQIIPGMQLVYGGSVTNQSLNEIYAANNIGLQLITAMTDHKASTFKKYANNTLIPDLKKKLSTSDVTVVFSKANGWDEARITVKKDGSPLRFIYLKNGQHPAAVLSKEETADFKKIEQSLTDVESTDLKDEAAVLKQVVKTNAQFIKDKKAHDLYNQAASGLQSHNSEDQIANLLAAEEVYSQGTVTINGGSYSNNEFIAVINFVPLNKDFLPASGVMDFKKIDGQWQLLELQLPNPLSHRR